MKDKQGIPQRPGLEGNKFSNLERRRILYIPNGYISIRMVDSSVMANNDGTEDGRYGIGQYGRCIYADVGPKGIYGADYYGAALYW